MQYTSLHAMRFNGRKTIKDVTEHTRSCQTLPGGKFVCTLQSSQTPFPRVEKKDEHGENMARQRHALRFLI